MDLLIVFIGGAAIIAVTLVIMAYSVGLQRKAVGTQDNAMDRVNRSIQLQEESVDRAKRSVELQEQSIAMLEENTRRSEEAMALQRETNALLRELVNLLSNQQEQSK